MRTIEYNRAKAVEYAHRWAFGRNPKFYDFTQIGGDCTNFASQVVFAGSGKMNYTPVTGWYYKNVNDRSPSWTGVQFLHDFLVNNNGVGPFAAETDINAVMEGDVVQLSFDGQSFGHSPVVVSTGTIPSLDSILVAAHTFNTDYRPLSTYIFQKIRFIHIMGVRI